MMLRSSKNIQLYICLNFRGSRLRDSRPIDVHLGQGLTLKDLLFMSLDVAKGCAYLEEVHFVHRDIAARNCLISSRDPTNRKVIIF